MFDYCICGGHIIDGSGKQRYLADIGISSGRIAAIGICDQIDAYHRIDAKDRVVCPGFIDMHSHSDLMLLANPLHEAKVMQGVTTDVIGLDGLSYAPLSSANLNVARRYAAGLNGSPDIPWNWSSVQDYLSRFDRKVSINVAYLIPHNALRLETTGFIDRPATREELKGMQKIVSQGMHEGAFGFSTGLDYCPARFSNTDELIEICKVLAEFDGLSVWHTRSKDLGSMEAIKEVIKVAEKTKVRAHLSHLATRGIANRGKSREFLAIIDDARVKGLDITFDSYPYLESSTTLLLVLPRWANDGGPDVILERLKDPTPRGRICNDMHLANPAWDQFVISSLGSTKNMAYIGKNLREAARLSSKEIEDFVCDLLIEEELSVGYVTGPNGNEEDIQKIMRHPHHMVCSDGILVGERPHPRAWGTFARFLGKYSRELGVLSLEEAIRHMTSAPSQSLRLKERGLIKQGYFADLVVFDPKNIIDKATFDNPQKSPKGIDDVFVNGAIVVHKGKHTGRLNGQALTML